MQQPHCSDLSSREAEDAVDCGFRGSGCVSPVSRFAMSVKDRCYHGRNLPRQSLMIQHRERLS